MYKILYSVVSMSYGNFSGHCGKYLDVDSAIEREIELRKNKSKYETFIIQVEWEIDNNV